MEVTDDETCDAYSFASPYTLGTVSADLPTDLRWLHTAFVLMRAQWRGIRCQDSPHWRQGLGLLWGVLDFGRGRFGPPPVNL